MTDCERLTQSAADLGEGPCWHAGHQRLYWVDIKGRQLHRFNPEDKDDEVFSFDQMIGTVAPYGDENLLLALQDSLISFDPATREQQLICDFEADRPQYRSNDGKCDPGGRFWIGSLGLGADDKAGNLYRMDSDQQLQHQLSDIGCSNGLAWDLTRERMYYIDSVAKTIYIFDYDNQSGAISNQQTFITFEGDMGVPDGMCIDNEDCIWVAQWGGYGVSRFDPDGQFIQKTDVPARNVTACTFGGPDLNQLYITSARNGDDSTEHDGQLYRVQVDASGQPAYHFKR